MSTVETLFKLSKILVSLNRLPFITHIQTHTHIHLKSQIDSQQVQNSKSPILDHLEMLQCEESVNICLHFHMHPKRIYIWLELKVFDLKCLKLQHKFNTEPHCIYVAIKRIVSSSFNGFFLRHAYSKFNDALLLHRFFARSTHWIFMMSVFFPLLRHVNNILFFLGVKCSSITFASTFVSFEVD